MYINTKMSRLLNYAGQFLTKKILWKQGMVLGTIEITVEEEERMIKEEKEYPRRIIRLSIISTDGISLNDVHSNKSQMTCNNIARKDEYFPRRLVEERDKPPKIFTKEEQREFTTPDVEEVSRLSEDVD
jgi:hypothetical protein